MISFYDILFDGNFQKLKKTPTFFLNINATHIWSEKKNSHLTWNVWSHPLSLRFIGNSHYELSSNRLKLAKKVSNDHDHTGNTAGDIYIHWRNKRCHEISNILDITSPDVSLEQFQHRLYSRHRGIFRRFKYNWGNSYFW